MIQKEEMVALALLENRIILGSSSPRRQEILSELGVKFEVFVTDCDETLNENLPIGEAIMEVSERKAKCIDEGDIVITSDTMVVLNGEPLGKPLDYNHAFKMLKMLSGNTHSVITAFTIKTKEKISSFVHENFVTFYEMTDSEIDNYIKKENPLDKAGSYGIQDKTFTFIKNINGDYSSIMGLPKSLLYMELKKMEVLD